MLKRYELRSIAGEGWAVIVIDTTCGFFAAVSDWGNYAYLWRAPGGEFRKFLMGLDADYLQGKLTGRARVYDSRATRECIKEALAKSDHGFSASALKFERELLDDLHSDDRDFEEWMGKTNLSDAYEYRRSMPEPQSWSFCTKVFPRFKEMLKKELADEQDPTEAGVVGEAGVDGGTPTG